MARNRLKINEERAGRPCPDNCEICDSSSKIVFDHCHETGEFRGWICNRYNLLLGNVKDDIRLLSKMVMYLRAFHFGLAYKRNGGYIKKSDFIED